MVKYICFGRRNTVTSILSGPGIYGKPCRGRWRHKTTRDDVDEDEASPRDIERPRRTSQQARARRLISERSVCAGAGRRAQKRPSAEAHVVLVTASCARKPAAAIMPSRACASSFSCEGESEGQARARARARRAAEARVERGLRGEGRGATARAEGRGAWGHTCIRRNSAGSSGAKPAGSKPIWPGLYPGQSK